MEYSVRGARRLIGFTALLVLLAACGDEENIDPSAQSEREMVATVDLSIGTLDGADPYIFGRISGVALDSIGRILVADAQADEVRVYSPDGEFIFAFGGSGAGPGEVSGPCCIAFGPEGSFWVRDGGNARYNRYILEDSTANYTGLTRMAHGDINFWAPTTFDRHGRLVDIGHSPDSATGELLTVRFHVDSLGAVVNRTSVHSPPEGSLAVHSVSVETSNGRSTRYFRQPFGPTQLIGHSPGGGWAKALSSQYEIEWHLADGSTNSIVRPEVGAGPTLSRAERTRAEERIAGDLESFSLARGDLPYSIPENKPPLRALHFDLSGRLWVELNVPDGEPRQADIFGLDGTRVATVEWPSNVSLQAIYPAQSVAVGIAVDSLGVQRVVRLQLEDI